MSRPAGPPGPRPRRAPPAPPSGRSLVGTELLLQVGPVAHGGHCVARVDGRVVFVRHTLPGERVRAVVTEGTEGDRFLRADAVRILLASPHRVAAPCRYAGPGGCGGCDWQHVEIAHQRRLKAQVVTEALRRLAGVDVPVAVEALPGAPDGLGWRTRVSLAVDAAGRLGLRRHRSHEVVPVDRCAVLHPRLQLSAVPADRRVPGGTVHLVAAAPGGRADCGQAPAAEVVERVVAGDWVGRFRLDVDGFWQAHRAAPGAYVARVLADLAPRAGERAVDLYAGVGLFAAPLADAVGPGGSVLAVEGDAAAARHAGGNLADRPWAHVHHAPVERAVGGLGHADLVVLDPPRRGARRAVVEAVCALGPRAVAYVACDPMALARDVGYAAARGYRLTRLSAVDAFPMTHHVECIALLEPASR